LGKPLVLKRLKQFSISGKSLRKNKAYMAFDFDDAGSLSNSTGFDFDDSGALAGGSSVNSRSARDAKDKQAWEDGGRAQFKIDEVKRKSGRSDLSYEEQVSQQPTYDPMMGALTGFSDAPIQGARSNKEIDRLNAIERKADELSLSNPPSTSRQRLIDYATSLIDQPKKPEQKTDRVQEYLDKGYELDNAKLNSKVDTTTERKLNKTGLSAAPDEDTGRRALQSYNPNQERDRVQAQTEELAKIREAAVYQQGMDRITDQANQNPNSYALGSGLIGAATGIANAPQALLNAGVEAAEYVSGKTLPKVPKWSFTKEAMDVSGAAVPDIAKKEVAQAYRDGDFGAMVFANVAQSAPSTAMSLAAMFVPALRPAVLPMMGATSAGQNYASGDSAIGSVLKGGIEVGTEMLPLGVFDKARKALNGLPLPDRAAVASVVARKVLQVGGEVSAVAGTNFIEEAVAQIGGNVVDRYVEGKKTDLMGGALKSGIVGAASGGMLAGPSLAHSLSQPGSKQTAIEQELSRQLDQSYFTDEQTSGIVANTLRTEPINSQSIRPEATVVSFADPNGPASQAGITPVTIPNVSTPSNTGGLATGAGDVGSPINVPSVGDTGSISTVGPAMGNAPAGAAPAGASASPVPQQSEQTTDVNPIKRTADSDLLNRVPTEQSPVESTPANNSAPATIWTGRSGSGYDTAESAQQAMESRVRKDPELDWKVEQRPDGKYHLAGYTKQEQALTQEAAQQQVVPGTEAVDLAEFGGEGYAVAPAKSKETVGELRAQQPAIDRLVSAIERSGEDASGIEAAPIANSDTPALAGAKRIVGYFAAVSKSAFGIDVVAVKGIGGLGVAHAGTAYANVDEISKGGKNSVVALAIGTIGHEAGHVGLEKSKDPEDKKAYSDLKTALRAYYKAGVVDKQLAFENAQSRAAGGSDVTRTYAENEVIQNINGAMWLDSKFWGQLYDLDPSSMRRVAYRFMQAATKMINAAKGTDLDIDTLVTNRDKVREIVAKTWAEKAMRSGKPPMSRTQINKLIDEDPANDAAFKRKDEPQTATKQSGVYGEVAPDPRNTKANDAWKSLNNTDKLGITKEVMDGVFAKVAKEMGLTGWSIDYTTGMYEGGVNPSGFIKAPAGTSTQELSEVGRVLGYILDQKGMVAFDESNTSSGTQAAFVKVILPAGMEQSRIDQIRQAVFKAVPQAEGDTLRDGSLVFGNFSEYNENGYAQLSDDEFADAIDVAVRGIEGAESVEVTNPQKFHSEWIQPSWEKDYSPTARDGFLEGTRYESNAQGLEAGGDNLRGTTGGNVSRAWLEQLAISTDRKIAKHVDYYRANPTKRPSTRVYEEASGAEREYGTPRKGAISRVGVHFSQQRRANLSSQYHGSGLKGAERDRMALPGSINDRLYFYVDKGTGVVPEAGVGGVKHTVKLNNLYDINKDASGYTKLASNPDPLKFSNNWERMVRDAGFDGYFIDNGGNQAFAVLLGKHDIEMPAYKRRGNDIDNIDDLGAFDLDADYANSTKDGFDFPDLTGADKKLDAAKMSPDERLRAEMADAEQFRRELEQELRAEGFGVAGTAKAASVKEKSFADVKPADIKAAGFMPETAYPDLVYHQSANGLEKNAYFVVDGQRYRATISNYNGPDIDLNSITRNKKGSARGVPLRYQLGGLSDEAREAWNKRFAASADLFGKGFDLYTSVPKAARDNILSVWKKIAENPDAFEFSKAKDPKGKNYKEVAQDIADQMLKDSKYAMTITATNDPVDGSGSFGFTIKDTKTGIESIGDIEFHPQDKEVTVHVSDLEKGSGTGKPVYQVAQAFATAFKSKIEADPQGLLGVNNYRRTEQMFSGALRSGNFDTMQPGVGQRIYGWNERAKTQEQQDRNFVRMALAATRNALEFAPTIKDFGYDLATDKFYVNGKERSFENDMVAGNRIKLMLQNKDARVASISRSTLARAAITLQAIDGNVEIPEDIANPVLYKRKGLDDYMDSRRKSMPLASPQSELDQDIETAVNAINTALSEIDGGNTEMLPVPIGRIPHVLTMLRIQPQMLRIDTSIIKKVFSGKHAGELGDITPEALVRSIYQPAMVLKSDERGEFEIVTSLVTPKGVVIVPIKPDSESRATGQKSAAVKSIYAKTVSGTGRSVVNRIKEGVVLYADPEQAQVAVTGRGSVPLVGINAGEAQFSRTPPTKGQDANVDDLKNSVKPLNPNFVGWDRVRGIILDGISQKKIKSDVDLVKWIGNQYKPGSSPDGWDDAPAFKRKGYPAAQGLPEETTAQAAQRILQDQYNRVKLIQELVEERGGTVGEEQNVYKAEERMHGRVHELMRQFADKAVHPMLKKAVEYKIDLDELALYAYAKHAKERNAHIQGINKQVQTGSGMSDAEADNIIQLVELSQDKAKFEELHQDLMGMTATTRRVLVDEGLVTQDQYDGLEKQYENYVPLRGFADQDEDNGKVRPGLGRGFNIKGQETIKAMGRDSKAGDIIENIIRDYERATIRAERNAVGKTFLDLVTTNPDPALWEVQPLKRATRMAGDQVRYQTVEDKGDDTISVKVAGEQVYIKINDPLLLRAMQNAFKSEKSDSEYFIMKAAGMYTSLLRNTITRYNPVFGVINALRDSQMGAAGVFDALGAEGLKLYAKNYPKAVASGFRTEIGKTDPQVRKMDKWMEEMRFAGGTTGGVFMRDTETIQSELRDAMMAAGASPKGVIDFAKHNKFTRGAKHVLHGLELIGATSEHAARLSAYAAAREMGKTPAEAASIAKNLTVNFNRFGEQGQLINTLFLFYNASVQGSTRIVQMMRNPKVRMAMAGATSVGLGLAMLAASVGGDDEDGQPYWDKIPDWEKERNLIIMLPPGSDMGDSVGTNGRYFKIPMAYGLNVFPVLGYQLADLMRNMQDPAKGVGLSKAAINMVSATMGSYNPMGGSLDPRDPIQLGLAVAPTMADPFIQLAAGVDGFGKPTGPSKSPYDQRPDSETVSAQQHGSVYHRISRWANEATGGNQVRAGAIDVQPGTIKNLGGIVGGGLGRFIADTINLGYLGATDAPISQRDIPVVKQLYGEYDKKAGMTLYYERSRKALDEFKDANEEFKAGVKKDYTAEEKFLYAMGDHAKFIGEAMGELKKYEIQISESSKTPKEKDIARRELQKAREKYAESFNKVWYEKESELKRKSR
jgi:hypothetical protein